MTANPFVLRLIEDLHAAGGGEIVHTTPCNRAIYVVEGEAALACARCDAPLHADEARLCSGALAVRPGAAGARLWRFELLPAPAADDGRTLGAGVRSQVKLAVVTSLPGAHGRLMRCDRVDLPPDLPTPKHTHAGPGIRCLLFGAIDAEIGSHRQIYRGGEAWFEPGPEPVIGRPLEPSAFVRVMILPVELQGQPSFRYWSDADKAIPRRQSFRLFFDSPIES
jgi:quercetin dioxygenase-like cupin family protein